MTNPKTKSKPAAQKALDAIQAISGGRHRDGVSRLIYERVRLAIVSALAVRDTLSFAELKTLLETTDGNLSVHTRKLEDAGLIECHKGFLDRVPRTEYRLTAAGRQALDEYLAHMEQLVKSIR